MNDAEVDKELLEKTVGGDSEAFAHIYDRHAAKVMRVVYNIVRDRQEAEDLLHDIFLEAWDMAGNYVPERGSVLSWLMVRARSRAIDRKRLFDSQRRKHRQEASAVDEREFAAPIETEVEAYAIHRALDQLTQLQRNVVMMSYFQGLTYREIAQSDGIPMGTVKSRLAAAISKLGQYLEAAREVKS